MSSTIKVKFLVDREKKRVVFAEAGSDFVDVLFSFLTLPLGSIVRLLSKQSCLGSLDNLYESVEQLDVKHLQTEACKDILLNPRSVAAIQCEYLKIEGIHELNPRSFYTCSQVDCKVQSTFYYTYASNCLCRRCGKLMDDTFKWVPEITSEKGGVFLDNTVDFIINDDGYVEWMPDRTSEIGGVFLIETTEFLITDDFRVIPSSLSKGFSLLQEMQIKDSNMLDEREIDLGREEILNFLRRSFVSKKVLTDVCFPDTCVQASVGLSLPIKDESFDNEAGKKIPVKLILNKENNKILYAEVGDDFSNLLFGFLTIPLGSILRLVSDNLFLGGCINNLYSSVSNIGLNYFKSEICRNMLMAPKLSAFHGCKDQILDVEEITSIESFTLWRWLQFSVDNGSEMCTSQRIYNQYNVIEQLNPKSAEGVKNNDGAFVAHSRRFMITDNLHISLLSVVSAIVNGKNLPISDLVEKEVFVDKHKARSLLSAILTSKTVLTDTFAPKPTS